MAPLLCSPSTSLVLVDTSSPCTLLLSCRSQQARPTSAPSTVLIKLTGVLWLMLSWCLSKVGRLAPTLHSPSVSLKLALWSTQGTFLDHLALVARGLPWSRDRTVTIRPWQDNQFLAGYHSQDTTQVADWNGPRSLKKACLFTCLRASARRAAAAHTNRGCGSALQEHRVEVPSLHSQMVQLTDTFQKGAYTFVWSPSFCSCHRETPPDCLVWKPARFTFVVPLYCIYFHTLKAAAWGSGLQLA